MRNSHFIFIQQSSFPFPAHPYSPQHHPDPQHHCLHSSSTKGQGKRRIQYIQSQGIPGKKASIPDACCLGQRKCSAQEGKKHPGIQKPRPDPSQKPAASQGKYQSRHKYCQRGENKGSPILPSKIPAVKYGGLRQAGKGYQAGSCHRSCAAGQGVPSGGKWRGIGEHRCAPGCRGSKKGEKKQRSRPQKGHHPT